MHAHELAENTYNLFAALRDTRPLVHVVTNFVVMNQTANVLLALGASPMMSWAQDDAKYMSGVSDALCINTGTPVADRISVMKSLMAFAGESGKPVVLDPVGAGAGPFRTDIARELCEFAPAKIIRGNPSEICALAAGHLSTKGVDSGISAEQARAILTGHGRPDRNADDLPSGATGLLESASALVVSGNTDMVLGQGKMVKISNGSELMGAVTGTGCILSAICAAFFAVAKNGFDAAVASVVVTGIAGELAAAGLSGPGFFLPHFIDSLYALTEADIHQHLRAEVLCLE
ncbi:hydroxyethylthiazole kinase [uncultured Desulfobacter sp.]|uniref:hydroxyethylthiazole kinase n=1 Tax=uncultured Desulfobacter sp. TaxID=240139 RepID=UPI0029F50F32|nr:hydroxyethylthiazole kinase [uncultured Desulfobacter sp.]